MIDLRKFLHFRFKGWQALQRKMHGPVLITGNIGDLRVGVQTKCLYYFALLWVKLDFSVVGICSVGSEDAPANPCRRSNKKSYKNHTEVDLIFATSIGKEFPDIFSNPKSLKSLLLPANGVPSHRLPEDCHYPLDDLVKLFLLPNVLVIVLYALLITCRHIHENL